MPITLLNTLLVATLVSLAVAWLIVRTSRWHGAVSGDPPAAGPQKLHTRTVPRIGGIAIALGLLAGLASARIQLAGSGVLSNWLWLVAALALAFGFGLAEDLTRRIGPWVRLSATFAAAAIASAGGSLVLTRFDFAPLDALLTMHIVMAFALTLFCVGAVAHAYNLSDGLNGLLGGLALAACCVIGSVAGQIGDRDASVFAVALGGASLGFLLLNFPRAHLFAGDSGAYLIGTAVAFLGIMLAIRNPGVSPWLAFLSVIYPFTDTTFAILRRMWQGRGIMQPDAEHLHSLLARWLARKSSTGGGAANPAATALILAGYAPFGLAAIAHARDSTALILLACVFAVAYVSLWFLLRKVVSAEESRLAGARAE